MDSRKAVTYKATLTVVGVVQGVGFRPFVARLARQYGLTGRVLNAGGQVRVEAYGGAEMLQRFVADLQSRAPKASRIVAIEKQTEPLAEGEWPPESFRIDPSGEAGGAALPSPDIALCDDCLRELHTPENPRYRNPFISCTHCGPRFTILTRLPYDRHNTAMEPFPLCALCDAQYHEPTDRRYHAQTVCCNRCGPTLFWRDPSGAPQATGEGALQQAVAALRRGQVIAVKGIGGYHFACDARHAGAMTALRALKGRESKPFAVMFADLDALKLHCDITPQEQALLTGAQRPIVLLKRRAGSDVAREVYGTSPYIGAFLPYTPLQSLLLDATFPLVMTSANPTGLPIITADDEMLAFMAQHPTLGGVAYHDRAILRRVDDSVVFVTDKKAHFVRRARGYVPLPIAFAGDHPTPLLALGAQQKSTVCLAAGGLAYPSTEIGDLDSLETMAFYRETVSDMQALLGIRPAMAVCDLHPTYESTRFAQETGLPTLNVQHHFAHIASVLAETGRRDRVIGVAFDGTGYGTDATVWGGEFLLATPTEFTRVGHLKALRFVGSDESVRQSWKSATCLLHDAGLPDCAADARYPALKAALNAGFNTIESSSMGRVFDGVSSLLDICHESAYEGQCAIELENAAMLAAQLTNASGCQFGVREEAGVIIADPAPCIRGIMACLAAGESPNAVALRFHMAVCQMIVEVCVQLKKRYGVRTVALSGGVFQNRILLANALPMLQAQGFETLVNHLVPSGDGGISLGQAYVAHCIQQQGRELCQCVSPLAES